MVESAEVASTASRGGAGQAPTPNRGSRGLADGSLLAGVRDRILAVVPPTVVAVAGGARAGARELEGPDGICAGGRRRTVRRVAGRGRRVAGRCRRGVGGTRRHELRLSETLRQDVRAPSTTRGRVRGRATRCHVRTLPTWRCNRAGQAVAATANPPSTATTCVKSSSFAPRTRAARTARNRPTSR